MSVVMRRSSVVMRCRRYELRSPHLMVALDRDAATVALSCG